MERTKIKEKVVDVIVDKLMVDKADVQDETKLVEDLGCDSLDLVELCIECEKVFSIRIDDDNFEKEFTVKDTVDVVEAILNKR